ncbi:BREX-1 system adenine-specific DNA-methyltransferase PglX [Exiguobacterium sp. s150]|uniref:BREX-1 system adenine-specific DNA-methyltransferase PglX n=1 Tax=Exiguobacterium sp. s150 TaxID=2751221 RepID=UPI0035302BDE
MEKVNKTELKNFAIQSRRQLIDQVKTKALLYGIDEKNSLEIKEQFGQLMINDKPYPLYMKQAFNSLKNQLKQKGYKQLVEEVAYTWFNRIIAIRYMEVHDYLPEKVNVLSSSVGRVDPDILFEYETMDLPVKQEEIRELLDAGDTEGAYRKLFIAQCNALNSILPFLFEQIQDYTELLLPDFLLDAQSVIKVLVQNDELTNSFEEIEVIGWLYQYYIAEEKDRVFAQKSKYKKEEIPFATQLFTPKWIVQYMVQNSLGRYWTESHREDEDLISNWEYFIKHEEEDFHEKIAPYVNKELRVEDIKLLDPAMGSGHILVYAFEVFHKIYEKCGYPERDIPRLIIENNLYGLDIDDRAYQLAAFAVVMKASSYSRRFLRSVEREGIQLNLASIQETNFISDSVIAYIAQEEEGERYNQVKAFFNQYENAKTYGSLIDITERDITFIEERLEHIQINPVEDLFYGEQHDIAKEVLPALVWQTKIMCNLYDIVVMNPPYMGIKNREENLNDFINKYYPNCKFDLYSAFIEKFSLSSSKTKILAAVTMQSWIYSPNFENFRLSIIENLQISQILSMDSMVMGIAFGTTATIFKQKFTDEETLFLKIKYPDLKNDKPDTFPNKSNLYKFIDIKKFKAIPYSPIAFDLPEEILLNYEKSPTLDKFGEGKFGLSTGDNEKFVRYWYEVCKDNVSIFNKNYKWIPLANGGEYRKWYGNNLEVINWMNNGEEIKNHPSSNIRNERFYFKEGITWTKLSSSKFGVRYLPSGFIFSGTSSSYFPYKTEDLTIVLAILSSNITKRILDSLNDTISYNIKDLLRIPIPKLNNEQSEIIKNKVKENIKISKQDWDSWEVSYDFSKHPLLYFKEDGYLSEIFKKRKSSTETQFLQLKKNEEYINQLFIELYKLSKELSYSVSDNDISLYKANEKSEAISLLSFYIGCLLGRYSLDVEGIAFAGGNWNPEKYGTFKANKGEIFQFTETSYFENDVIIRLREFLAVVYSSETVDENIQWLAEALEMKKGEDAETRLRRYFIDEFFEEHCKMYQKRPIYWLVDSGKQKGLRTLIYMHRYQPDTMATIRFEHLQEIQAKYQNEITDLENRLVNPNLSASEKKKLTAEKTSFEKKMDELREFDKRLAEIANEEIEIDLDDGVKVNYEKFYRGGKGVLAKIK